MLTSRSPLADGLALADVDLADPAHHAGGDHDRLPGLEAAGGGDQAGDFRRGWPGR